jgi:hypothetical protein
MHTNLTTRPDGIGCDWRFAKPNMNSGFLGAQLINLIRVLELSK